MSLDNTSNMQRVPNKLMYLVIKRYSGVFWRSSDLTELT